MKKFKRLISGLLLMVCLGQASAATGIIQRGEYLGREDVESFVADMVKRHGFEVNELRALLAQGERQKRVLELVSKPAEGKDWSKYRPIFVNDKRINAGVKFWNKHEALLQQAEEAYQVPAEIIVAIIGVETFYGTRMGTFPVLDTLMTLGFDYPPRSKFFKRQLEEFLLLSREQNIDPLEPKGSYAAAMGMGQFISSSYRDFAVDFDNDGQIDLWRNFADGIGSVANYFSRHHWDYGKSVIAPAYVKGKEYKQLKANQLKPSYSKAQLAKAGVSGSQFIADKETMSFLDLKGANGREYWLGHHNFYVITRYNHSVKYALAVFQLSQAVKRARLAQGG